MQNVQDHLEMDTSSKGVPFLIRAMHWLVPSWLVWVWNVLVSLVYQGQSLTDVWSAQKASLYRKQTVKFVDILWLGTMLMGLPLAMYLDPGCETGAPASPTLETLRFARYEPVVEYSVATFSMASDYECNNDKNCSHGTCQPIKDLNGSLVGSECVCDCDYATVDDAQVCSYSRLPGLTVLLLSIFLGGCGIDRCFLARGNGCHICIGILKGLTCGGLSIWVWVDIALLAQFRLHDGNGELPSKFSC